MKACMAGAALAVLLTSTGASAADGAMNDGSDLLEACTAYTAEPMPRDKVFIAGACGGLIQGVRTTIDYYNQTGQKTSVCIPREVTNGQLVRVAMTYLNSHPATLHHEMVPLEISAFREVFPCK